MRHSARRDPVQTDRYKQVSRDLVDEESRVAVHWVNYDLNQTGQNYTDLIAYLKSHTSWAKPLKSSFFVKTDLTAGQLRDGIKGYIDANDDVVIVPVGGMGWATYGLSDELNTWLRNNL